MKQFIFSEKESTYNIIHDSGVQTSVKVNPSGSFSTDNLDRDSPTLVEKQKYTVIISSSHGCQMSCTFCHLTQSNKSFTPISSKEIISNVMEALALVKELDPTISNRYIKLCYMGEGEALLNMENTQESSVKILQLAVDGGYAIGVDGVDISTCMPKIGAHVAQDISDLNNVIASLGYRLNPYNHEDVNRSAVRLFYSLHHYDKTKRDILIPRSRGIETTLSMLDYISSLGVNVVVHYMFMNGVNDSAGDAHGLVNFINSHREFSEFEFRVLRYNGFGDDRESDNLQYCLTYLQRHAIVGKLKIQYSAGEDIKAACGMFI